MRPLPGVKHPRDYKQKTKKKTTTTTTTTTKTKSTKRQPRLTQLDETESLPWLKLRYCVACEVCQSSAQEVKRKLNVLDCITGRLISSCRYYSKKHMNNFKHNRNKRKSIIVKNAIVSFQPNVPENYSSL